MARKQRLHSPGAVYRVILRGNARHDIFADDKDRYRFYNILEKSIERFNHRIHGFCLPTNQAEIPFSKIMQNVSMRYTQWFNWRHTRSAHIFQGRYKAIMMDADVFGLCSTQLNGPAGSTSIQHISTQNVLRANPLNQEDAPGEAFPGALPARLVPGALNPTTILKGGIS